MERKKKDDGGVRNNANGSRGCGQAPDKERYVQGKLARAERVRNPGGVTGAREVF